MHRAGHTILLPEQVMYDKEFAKVLYKKRDKLSELVSCDKNYDSDRFKKLANRRNQIMEIADYYAVKIEREDPNDSRGLAKRIKDAWAQLDSLDTTKDPICHSHVIGVLRNLTYGASQRHPHGYRDGDFELIVAKRLCDNQKKIYSLMDSFLYFANGIRDPLKKALYLHIGIAHLQPGLNGNKRAGQLLSDKVLDNIGFPIPFIPEVEHEYYSQILYKASCQIDLQTPEQMPAVREAANYLLQRISASIDLLGECSQINSKKSSIVKAHEEIFS
ncbi:MAG: hypothetical protein ACMXYF_02915 [Candidatus Woesearchaeota archaeon]